MVQQSENETVRARSYSRLREHLIFWPIVIVGLAADLWTKKAVFEWLESRNQMVHVVIKNYLNLIIAENTGAAFSIASGQRTLLLIVSLAAAVAVLFFFFFGQRKQPLVTLALALFFGGILGNAHDRIFNNGMVRDFIDVHYKEVYHWPTFNVADSMLCVAVFLLLLMSFTKAGQKS